MRALPAKSEAVNTTWLLAPQNFPFGVPSLLRAEAQVRLLLDWTRLRPDTLKVETAVVPSKPASVAVAGVSTANAR